MTASRAGPQYLERDRYTALVIGSGFGGAVSACRLAQAGIDVAIVERGRRWSPGTFPRDLSRLDDGWLWACDHGLYDARPLNDILAITAAGYGGGSLVYANVAVRPPPEVFDAAWPEPYRRPQLDPYFDLAAYMLDIQPVTADPRTGQPLPKTRFMAEAADRLGYADGFFHPNLAVTFADHGPGQVNKFGVPQRGCTFSAECDIGCNVGAKNSLDLTYLALAERSGATVGTRTEAVHIARDGDGYKVALREHGHPNAGRDGIRRDVSARYVFVCAGALGTTELLLRSRDQYRTLPDLPSALGTGYSGNGDFLSFGADTQTPFEPGIGPTITTATVVHSATTGVENWFVIEDGGYSEHLAKLVRDLDLGRLPGEVSAHIGIGTARAVETVRGLGARLDDGGANTAVMLAMGRDRADGRIELRGRSHRLHVTWDTTRNDPLYSAEGAVSAEFVRAFGGRPFVTPTWRLFRQPVSVHNLGGARMGTDPTLAVVDPDGEVFGHPGLFVLDGAALPGVTGGNPSLTIAAVAERCIESAIRRIRNAPGWEPPERSQVVRGQVPEDAVVRRVVARPAHRLTRGGLRFHEVMRGSVAARPGAAGRRVVLELRVQIDDLDEFLLDPVHLATVTGTAYVDGLTGQPAAIVDGTLHLLAAVDDGPRRSMDYSLPFVDDSGKGWLLRGSKHVERGRARGPWGATTRLELALVTPEERYDSLRPTGLVSISVPDVLRQLATLRATGPGNRRRAAGMIVRFGTFFVTEVAGAFLRPPAGLGRRAPIDKRPSTGSDR